MCPKKTFKDLNARLKSVFNPKNQYNHVIKKERIDKEKYRPLIAKKCQKAQALFLYKFFSIAKKIRNKIPSFQT